ncbi:MAG: hypothetical protein NXH88_17940 [Hyphomonas sp.]|nr:hypothetical protein [Hyphomonas sp.]
MELSTASVATLLGVLFGLIFVGLFTGGYVLDRTVRFILWYLAAGIALVISGATYFLSMVTPYPAFFVVLVEVFQSLGIIALGFGLAARADSTYSGSYPAASK